MIVSGGCRMSRTNPAGWGKGTPKEKIDPGAVQAEEAAKALLPHFKVADLGPHDYFGDWAVLKVLEGSKKGGAPEPCTVVATSRCEVVYVPATSLIKQMGTKWVRAAREMMEARYQRYDVRAQQ
eukprot:8980139-Pyramimonas_sp.AAC.1